MHQVQLLMEGTSTGFTVDLKSEMQGLLNLAARSCVSSAYFTGIGGLCLLSPHIKGIHAKDDTSSFRILPTL